MRRFKISLLVVLFVTGLILRLWGLWFNGMLDIDQFIFQWGSEVRQLGFARLPRIWFGLTLAYALFGVAARIAEQIPRYWWAPYKLAEILFEIGIFLILYKLLPPRRKYLAILMYWLNPWFIIHGAWQGFFDGSYTLLGLIGVFYLRYVPNKKLSWILLGVFLMAAGMLKPQGLVYFLIPVAIYLGLQFILCRNIQFVWFILGIMMPFAVLLIAARGDIAAIFKEFVHIAAYMPNLSNASFNIWRPVTRILQVILGQGGSTFLYVLLISLVSCVTLALIGLFSLKIILIQGQLLSSQIEKRIIRKMGLIILTLFIIGLFWKSDLKVHPQLIMGRYSLQYTAILVMIMLSGILAVWAAPFIAGLLKRLLQFGDRGVPAPTGDIPRYNHAPYFNIFLILAFCGLVIPQIGPMAHANHTYSGLVLLIPLAIANRRILISWATMIAINLYCPLAMYQLGRSTVLPGPLYLNYAPAQPLILKIKTALINQPNTALLQFQNNVNQFLIKHLPEEPVISVLSVIQFVCVIVIIREMFALTTQSSSGIIFESTLKG